jgi:hypothetical protein
MPDKLKVSIIRLVLIFKSSGESVAREGERLISINQGLKIYKQFKVYLLEIAVNQDIVSEKLEAGILGRKFLEVLVNCRINRKK